MTALELDAKFADLYIEYYNAEDAYKTNPNKETREHYLDTGRRYSKALRERQDEKAKGRGNGN